MVVDKGDDGKTRVTPLDANLPLSASFARMSQS
jgi:hypothetical protein